jgi:hypothetical protein
VQGTYSIKYTHGAEQLTLNADGSYVQSYIASPGRLMQTNTGRWQFNRESPSVYLADALLFDSGFNQALSAPRRTAWSLPVLVSATKIRLQVNDDESLYFERRRP